MGKRYWVCGVNSMGSTWYLSDPKAKECTLWSGAPKSMRAVFNDLKEAEDKVKELNESFRFATTRHFVEKEVI